jgi:hypothetical protein
MTVATEFFNWQTSGLNHLKSPWNRCAPALMSLDEYLKAKWGGAHLGCHHDRNIKNTTVISSHAFGAALDWRYESPGIGRRRMLDEVIPFLIENSAELGVQAIHDYFGSRIWRCNRANDVNGGWREQPKVGPMGQSWAKWIHIEVNRTQWKDGRPVAEKVVVDKPVIWPPFNPEKGEFGLYPLNPNKPRLQRNSTGDAVRYLQGVLRKNRYQIAVDGSFGPQTRDRVIRFQRANGLLTDGIVGNKTWAKIDQASN